MSQVDILLPFALPPPELARDLLHALATPALATLLAQAKSSAMPGSDAFSRALPHEAWLCEQFGISSRQQSHGSPPIAIAAMKQIGLDAPAGIWFLLQPVHIHVARDHLVLTDVRQLVLTTQDSRALFAIAEPFFEEVGKSILYGDANTWFVRADDWSDLQTATPDATCGHNIDIWMPKGPEAISWRKLQNEVQMAWHAHALNDAREESGLKPVNSIWLWGGTPSVMATEPAQYRELFVPHGWMQAFGQFASLHPNATSAAEVIAAAPSKALLVLDTLIEPGLAGDWAEWIDRMHVLERDWLAPMLDAVKSGKIARLALVPTNSAGASHFAVTKQSLRKFWVKPALSRLLP